MTAPLVSTWMTRAVGSEGAETVAGMVGLAVHYEVVAVKAALSDINLIYLNDKSRTFHQLYK